MKNGLKQGRGEKKKGFVYNMMGNFCVKRGLPKYPV